MNGTDYASRPSGGNRASARSRHQPILVRVAIALVMLIGGGFIATRSLEADAAVTGGTPSDADITAVAFWAAEGWPVAPGKKQIVHQETRFVTTNPGATAFRNYGRFGDRDGQLTAWITANLPGAVTPQFAEYDYNWRSPRNTPRDAMRIVRDYANGVVFITRNHYTDFETFGIGDNTEVAYPDVDENTKQGPSSEADHDDGEVAQPPANEANVCANPTNETCPAAIPGNHMSADPIGDHLRAQNDAMMAQMDTLAGVWLQHIFDAFNSNP